MKANAMQCCYTNASIDTGGTISSGWQAVCMSPELPAEAYANCVKLQNANSSIQGKKLDENGNVLNLFEVQGDGLYIYVCRTQYGLLDRLGRANMFSHAFIFPCKGVDFINDPNNFLTVSRDNFKSSVQDAENADKRLKWDEDFDLEIALKNCSLTDENFQRLLQCVYIKYTDRSSSSPLYIQYDGTDSQMMQLLFCIYSALPLSIRRNLSVSSMETDNSSGKNLIFSKNARSKSTYFIPETGETNVLTPRIELKLFRLGFVDYAARKHRTLDEPLYFKMLEVKSAELGDITATNELILKIAHFILCNVDYTSISDPDLDMMLSDSLRTKTQGNSSMDEHIARLVHEITARKLALSVVNEQDLLTRVEHTSCASLKSAIEDHNFFRFSNLTANEAASELKNISPVLFRSYCKRLSASESGLKILDCFFAEKLGSGSNLSWNSLQAVLDESAFMENRKRVTERVDASAWELYCREIDSNANLGSFDLGELLSKYMGIMQHLIKPDETRRCLANAKEEFWDRVPLSSLDFGKYEQYKAYYVNSTNCNAAFEYFELVEMFGKRDRVTFMRAAYVFFSKRRLKTDEKELAAEKSKLLSEVLKHNVKQSEHISDWLNLFLDTPAGQMFVDLKGIYSAVNKEDFISLRDAFRSYLLYCADDLKYFNNARSLSSLLKTICIDIDKDGGVVPLDIWLQISVALIGNSFELFDEYKPVILQLEPADVVKGSSYIRKPKFIQDAEYYIGNKGEEAKTVRRWLSASSSSMKEAPHGKYDMQSEKGRSFRKKKEVDNDDKGGPRKKSFLCGLFGKKE